MKKLITLLLVVAMLLSLATVGFAEEPIVITLAKKFNTAGQVYPEGQSAENNYYIDYVEATANVDIEFEWILADDTEKISMAITSGQMPDAMIVDRATFNMLLENDMLVSLTEAWETVGKNSILATVAENYPMSFADGYVGNELMAIPNSAAQYENTVLWVRNDWLENLGLEAPKTLDELKAVMKAFVENDPDGDGVADTIGLGLYTNVFCNYNTSGSANDIAALFGGYPSMWYENENGEIVYGSLDNGTREALEWLAGCYAEGLLDKEFAAADLFEKVVNGQCGMFFGRPSVAANECRQSHAFDGADWHPVLCPMSENNTFVSRFRPASMSYVVVSKECAHPEKILEIIAAEYNFHWNNGLDEEWQAKLNEYLDTGVVWANMPLNIQMEKTLFPVERYEAFKQYLTTGSTEGFSTQVMSFIQNYEDWKADPTSLTGWAYYRMMYEYGQLLFDSGIECTYMPQAFSGTTDSMTNFWTTLETMEIETFVKIVMGEADITEFDEFVKKWYDLGGETIVEEVREYVANH